VLRLYGTLVKQTLSGPYFRHSSNKQAGNREKRDYLLLLMEGLRNRQYIYRTNRIATLMASFFEVGMVPVGLSQKRQTPLLDGRLA